MFQSEHMFSFGSLLNLGNGIQTKSPENASLTIQRRKEEATGIWEATDALYRPPFSLILISVNKWQFLPTDSDFTDPETIANTRGIYESLPSFPSTPALGSTCGVTVAHSGISYWPCLLPMHSEPQSLHVPLATATVQPCRLREKHILCFWSFTVRLSFWATGDSVRPLFTPLFLLFVT